MIQRSLGTDRVQLPGSGGDAVAVGSRIAGRISVLLADDYNVVRQGLRALLSAENDIAVVDEADNGRQAVLLTAKHRPDVVLMDYSMPDLNGIEATRQISRETPGSRVVIFSSHVDDEIVGNSIRAGAIGYVLKQTNATELIRAIREARHGHSYFSPAISRRISELQRRAFIEGRPIRSGFAALTPREREVLQLIAEGHSSKQIAYGLGISFKTVEKHRQSVMDRLNIHEVAGLTRYAIARGIIEVRPILDCA